MTTKSLLSSQTSQLYGKLESGISLSVRTNIKKTDSLTIRSVEIDTNTYTYLHTRSLRQTHASLASHPHTCTLAQMLARRFVVANLHSRCVRSRCVRSHTRAHTHVNAHTCVHIQFTLTHKHKHTHTHKTQVLTYTQLCARTHIYTFTHTHAHTCADAHTHTNAHLGLLLLLLHAVASPTRYRCWAFHERWRRLLSIASSANLLRLLWRRLLLQRLARSGRWGPEVMALKATW